MYEFNIDVPQVAIQLTRLRFSSLATGPHN